MAERVRYFKVAGEILEQRGVCRIDSVAGEEAVHRLEAAA